MIKLENVNKYFYHHKKNEIHVINNINIELPDKGLVALLGPSGCGKTTLLNTIGGLDRVDSGKIFINNKRLTKKSSRYIDKERNLNIGYIFQNYYLVNSMTVFENVALSLRMFGLKDKEEIKTRVNYVLETLGIYRYRNRLANMLSGGERQRVGIARAIVKNPNIIIADEPTGNLDSSNTIEIMNIIKSISKNRLVILVTHENDIAKFYADRVLEIEDGTIIKDYDNKHNEDLDYRIDNKIYLKDFKYCDDIKNIKIYNDKKADIKLTIVVKNNNIFIQSNTNEKIEVVDSDSNIELLDEHYKKIDKTIYEKYEFDFENVIKENKKPKYSSIISFFKLFTLGFEKMLDYTFIKKLLLLGFLASGIFITYSISNLFGLSNVDDKYFISKNREYYDVTSPNIKIDNYLAYEKINSVDYILPNDTSINFNINFPYYYQTSSASSTIAGSLTDSKLLTNDDIVEGRLPNNDYEIVVDKMVLNNTMEKGNSTPKQVGIKNISEFINKTANLKNMKDFIIVGISDKNDPSIYVRSNMLINALSNTFNQDSYDYYAIDKMTEDSTLVDYKLIDNINLKKGRLPENDYEVIINIQNEDMYPLNKKLDYSIQDTKLTVVGYYESNKTNDYYVNENTILYKLIGSSKTISVMPKDKDSIVTDFNNKKTKIESSYDTSKSVYLNNKKDAFKAGMIVSMIFLAISLIEIYLMIRASFLSRVKEIGIYRAIGVKKTDIYKMFLAEIYAITTVACVPGVLFMSYAINKLRTISYIEQNYLVNATTILVSLIVIYGFNLIVGLLPVANVVRHTPAKILARKDLD